MTILFITHYAGFYGANKSLLTLMLLLRGKYGVRPLVLSPCDGEMCRQLRQHGIEYKIHHYYWWVNYNHGLLQWFLNKRKQLINHLHINRICSLYENEQIDILYTNSVCVNIGIAMAERLHLPHMWQMRESLSQFSLSLSLSLSRRLWAKKVNKRYILISDYMMQYYKTFLPNERMVKIYNGVSLPNGVEPHLNNYVNSRLQVVCMGVVGPQKNQFELLRAQAILHQRGIDIDTWIIGAQSNAEYMNKLQSFVEHEDIEEFVHFAGHQDNVFDILRNMNLGVVTAHDEAFGRVTIEYMLMGLPVVASNSGANAELIGEGITGRLYTLGNAKQLADLIDEYIKSPQLLQQQSKKAIEYAKRNFSAEKNAELIYNQICEILNTK